MIQDLGVSRLYPSDIASALNVMRGPIRNLLCAKKQSMKLIVFFQAEDGIRDVAVTGVQTCALPISLSIDWGVVAENDGIANSRPPPFVLRRDAGRHRAPVDAQRALARIDLHEPLHPEAQREVDGARPSVPGRGQTVASRRQRQAPPWGRQLVREVLAHEKLRRPRERDACPDGAQAGTGCMAPPAPRPQRCVVE